MPLGQLGAGIGMGEGNYMNARLPFQVAGGGTGIGQPMASLSGSIPGYQAGMPYGVGAPFNQPQGGMAAPLNINQAAPTQPQAMISGSIPGYQGGMAYGAAPFNLPAQPGGVGSITDYEPGAEPWLQRQRSMSTAGMNPGANALYPQMGGPQPETMYGPGGPPAALLAQPWYQAMLAGQSPAGMSQAPAPQADPLMMWMQALGGPQIPRALPTAPQPMGPPPPPGAPTQPLAPFQGPQPGQAWGGLGVSNMPTAMPQGMLNNPAVQQTLATGGPWGGAMNMNYMRGLPAMTRGPAPGLGAFGGGLGALLGGGRAGLPFSPGPVAAPPMPALPARPVAKTGLTSDMDRMRPARPQRQMPGRGGGR